MFEHARRQFGVHASKQNGQREKLEEVRGGFVYTSLSPGPLSPSHRLICVKSEIRKLKRRWSLQQQQRKPTRPFSWSNEENGNFPDSFIMMKLKVKKVEKKELTSLFSIAHIQFSDLTMELRSLRSCFCMCAHSTANVIKHRKIN